MVRFFCDGCNKEINEQEMAEARAKGLSYADSKKLDKQIAQQIITEILCASCVETAPAYWDAKKAIFEDGLEILRRRLNKHRNQFWLTASRLSVVSK